MTIYKTNKFSISRIASALLATVMVFSMVPQPVAAAEAPTDIVLENVQSILKDFLSNQSASVISSFEDPRISQVRSYFEQYNRPAAKYAEYFVKYADEYNLPDWRMLAAIAQAESSGCRYMKGNNCFGYGTTTFSSIPEGIEHVAERISGGNNAYKVQTVKGILNVYNPLPMCKNAPGKIKNQTCLDFSYEHRVMSVMEKIAGQPIS